MRWILGAVVSCSLGCSATAPARSDGALHYVDAHGTAPLRYDIALDHAGRHSLRVTYVDGWARRRIARKHIHVFVKK